MLLASDWERAAIVAAFVEMPGQGARSDLASSSEVLSPEQFAALGIVGLKSKDTVRRYLASTERHTPSRECGTGGVNVARHWL